MIEHRKSGLLKALGPAVSNWNRSIGELYVANGSKVYCDGADDGALRIQGEELRGAWCDEIGLWRAAKGKRGAKNNSGGLQAWEESLQFAVREEPALIIATGTPKGKKGVVKLLTEEPEGRVAFTRPSLDDNRRNLAAAIVATWERKYAGTRLGRQELKGEILDDVEGALWTLEMIEAGRLSLPLDYCRGILNNRCVVAVDPAITAHDESDETGIVAAQTVPPTSDLLRKLLEDDPTTRADVDHALILEDRSGVYTPDGWAKAAIELYEELRADRIVAEVNQGGDMVETVIHGINPNVPVTKVWAKTGKQTRAEPVAALYEQFRVHHVMREGHDGFEFLESEQTSWVPGEPSPNHMDAAVYAITDLLIEQGGGERTFAEDDAAPVQSETADLLTRPM